MGGRLPLGLPMVRKKSSKSLICFKWNIHIEHLRHSSTHWFLLRTSVMVAVRCGRGQERRHSGYPSSSRLLVTLCIMILKPLQPDSWVWLSRSPSFSLSRLSRSAAPNLSLSLCRGGGQLSLTILGTNQCDLSNQRQRFHTINKNTTSQSFFVPPCILETWITLVTNLQSLLRLRCLTRRLLLTAATKGKERFEGRQLVMYLLCWLVSWLATC